MFFSLAIAVVLSALSLTEGTVGTVCKNDTVCGDNECCYIQPEFLVASKRGAPFLLPGQVYKPHDTGVCESYRSLHEQCGALEKMNGHCGCGSGMSCQFVPSPTDALIASKRRIYMPGPGAYQCELTN